MSAFPGRSQELYPRPQDQCRVAQAGMRSSRPEAGLGQWSAIGKVGAQDTR